MCQDCSNIAHTGPGECSQFTPELLAAVVVFQVGLFQHSTTEQGVVFEFTMHRANSMIVFQDYFNIAPRLMQGSVSSSHNEK